MKNCQGVAHIHPDRRRFLTTLTAVAVISVSSINVAPSAHSRGFIGMKINAKTAALVLIDLQISNSHLPFKPLPFEDIVRNGALVAEALRKAGGLIVYTCVLEAEALSLPADKPLASSPSQPNAANLAAGIVFKDGDALVTKRQWGAFYGTDLEQQLRRHKIDTLIVAGVATEVGVESTVREAFDRGYSLIFVDDAISGATLATHDMFLRELFPRMGRLRSAADVVRALAAS